MPRSRSNITGFNERSGGKHVLNISTPLIHNRDRRNRIPTTDRDRQLGQSSGGGETSSTHIQRCTWAISFAAKDLSRGLEWYVLAQQRGVTESDVSVEDAGAGADRSLAATGGIPGKAQSWLEVAIVLLEDSVRQSPHDPRIHEPLVNGVNGAGGKRLSENTL